MNPIADDTSVDTLTPHVPSPPKKTVVWPVLIAVLVYPMLSFGLGMGSREIVLSFLGSALSYPLAMYLYRGIPGVVASGRVMLLALTALAAVLLGAVWCPSPLVLMMLSSWLTIVGAGVVVGYRLRTETSQLRLYLWGLAIVTIGALAVWVPQLPMMMSGVAESMALAVEDLKKSFTMAGVGEGAVADYMEQAQKLFAIGVHLIPSLLIMTTIMQYSIGFLWFMHRDGERLTRTGKLCSFMRWRVPFAVTPVLVVLAVTRLIFGQTVAPVTDNVMTSLSVFYCVTGLSLVTYVLDKGKVSLALRIPFYVMLTLTGLFGYFGLTLLGFLDSFFDWRKPRKADVEPA